MFDDYDLSIDKYGKIVLSEEIKQSENYNKYNGKILQLDKRTLAYL